MTLISAMYCSVECQKNDVFHQSQCPFIEVNENFSIYLRMKEKAFKIAGGNQELFDLWDRAGSGGTVFDFDLSDPTDPDYDKKRLIAVSMLAKNIMTSRSPIRESLQDRLLKNTPVANELEGRKFMMIMNQLYVIFGTNAYKMYDMKW